MKYLSSCFTLLKCNSRRSNLQSLNGDFYSYTIPVNAVYFRIWNLNRVRILCVVVNINAVQESRPSIAIISK
jgi:hypothetical protein